MRHPRKVNRVINPNPFTVSEQLLCLMPIIDLRERFRRMKWHDFAASYRYLSAIPGIRARIFGKEGA